MAPSAAAAPGCAHSGGLARRLRRRTFPARRDGKGGPPMLALGGWPPSRSCGRQDRPCPKPSDFTPSRTPERRATPPACRTGPPWPASCLAGCRMTPTPIRNRRNRTGWRFNAPGRRRTNRRPRRTTGARRHRMSPTARRRDRGLEAVLQREGADGWPPAVPRAPPGATTPEAPRTCQLPHCRRAPGPRTLRSSRATCWLRCPPEQPWGELTATGTTQRKATPRSCDDRRASRTPAAGANAHSPPWGTGEAAPPLGRQRLTDIARPSCRPTRHGGQPPLPNPRLAIT